MSEDKIRIIKNIVYHESAGGFLFYRGKKNLYVALLKKKDGGYFVPKGHVMKGERLLEAALREVKEELSLKGTPTLISNLGINKFEFNLPDDNKLHKKKVYLYVFELKEKLKISPEKDVYEKAVWLEVDNAKKLMQYDVSWLNKAIQKFYSSDVAWFDTSMI